MGESLTFKPIVVTSSGYTAAPLGMHRLGNTVEQLNSVRAIYDESRSNQPWIGGFDFTKRAIEACAYPYGDFVQWALLHAQSVNLSSTQFDFIEDCIRFIATGKRRLQLTLWARLVIPQSTEQISESAHAARVKRLTEAGLGSSVSSNPIPMWCSHENGLSDMIISTAILFGGIQVR